MKIKEVGVIISRRKTSILRQRNLSLSGDFRLVQGRGRAIKFVTWIAEFEIVQVDLLPEVTLEERN